MIFRNIFLVAIAVSACSQTASAEGFSNPLIVDKTGQCKKDNIDPAKFAFEIDESRKIDICTGVAGIVERLNADQWSDELRIELTEIWKTFATKEVYFSPMPPNMDSSIFAIAHSFPPGRPRDVFSATIYLKNGVENKNFFYHVVFHELRHVFDFNDLWVNGTDVPLFELERRAFRLMSLIDEETPKEKRSSKTPSLWQDDWKDLDKNSRENKRSQAISKLMKKSTHYKNLPEKETTLAKAPSFVEPNDLEVQSPPKLIRRRDP